MIIAIDGPAASGKGTLARRLAAHFGLAYLDTGSLYRAVALTVMADDADPLDETAASTAARSLDPDRFAEHELRSAGAGEAASKVASLPAVRQALLEFQRQKAATPPGAVLDGRDIGTVVCPDADVKLFVTADPEVRARRRHLELAAAGSNIGLEELVEQLRLRDERDAARAVAPLKPADGAYLLDTSQLDIEAAFQAAVEIVENSMAG